LRPAPELSIIRQDKKPLKLAELIEREFGGFVPPPDFDD
jgi:amidase